VDERKLLAIQETINTANIGKEVTLVAASKTQATADLVSAYELGIRDFGENYLKEALPKIEALAHLALNWHFIGRIQSNKTRAIAESFDWVHCVDREKVARRLSDHRSPHHSDHKLRAALNVLIQVNVDDDPNKGGVSPSEVEALVEVIDTLPNLKLRGLMTILHPSTNPREGYASVAQLALEIGQILAAKEASNAQWDTLSMGMSADLADAISSGSTMVRIGTALFGPRA
jgi:pyridoxal phosphate enzyme (YggS family)